MSVKRATKFQIDMLVSFIMKNRAMINGNKMDPSVQSLWSKLTDELNNTPGVFKSCREWMETYKLLARKTKFKARKIITSIKINGTNEGQSKLNQIEKKVMEIEGQECIFGTQQQEAAVPQIIPESYEFEVILTSPGPSSASGSSTTGSTAPSPAPENPPQTARPSIEKPLAVGPFTPDPPTAGPSKFVPSSPGPQTAGPSTKEPSKDSLSRRKSRVLRDFQECFRISSENLCRSIDAHGDKMLEGMRLISEALLATANKH